MARRRHSNRRHRGRFRFLYKVLSVIVLCVVVVLALTLFFRVDRIVVSGQQRYTEQEIVEVTGVQQDDNLYLLNKLDISNNLLKKLPYIEMVQISRKLPDTLLIEVQECDVPLAIVQDNEAWLISPKGKIVEHLEQSESESIPEYVARNALCSVTGCKILSPVVGESMTLVSEQAVQQQSLMDLLAALQSAGLMDQAEAISLEDSAMMTMRYAGRFLVQLPYSADYAYKLRALVVVVEKLETNQTGTIQLTRDDGQINFIEE